MISKELLSEVLKENILAIRPYIEDDIVHENIIMYECGKNTYGILDIYELAHECKQWAVKNSYGISVHTSEISGYIVEINCGFDVTDFHNISEPEAIFKACQYIMENKCGS